MYERSYMHKETVTQSKSRLSLTCIVLVAQKFDFLITVSLEGVLKFWRKV